MCIFNKIFRNVYRPTTPNSTRIPEGRDECFCGDRALLLSPPAQEPVENAERLASEQHPLLGGREEVALSSGLPLMPA